MTVEERIIADPETLEWIDATAMTQLPKGVQVKLLSESTERDLRNFLAWFPAGYVEPRHAHEGDHSTFLLEGRWIVEGKELGPGGYMYGPGGIAHGPFESPEGSLVFASVRGGGVHVYPPPPEAEEAARGKRTVIVAADEVAWQDAAERFQLPAGVEFKLYDEDAATGRLDGLGRFPPGYVEPRHTHAALHSDALLEGRWIIEGQEVGMGGHIYGPPDVPHGPFECPEGVVVCAAMFGSPIHEWD